MDDTFEMGTGLAHEITLAMRRVGGWTPESVKKMTNGNFLAGVLDVLEGRAEIKSREHLIDCTTPVYAPKGWSVLPDAEQIASRVTCHFVFDVKSTCLYLSSGQRGGVGVNGNYLWKELAQNKVAVYTAHLLDYLLKPENQHLVPEEWKGKAVFFWGTIYRASNSRLYVRCLEWRGNGWFWNYCCLVNNFSSRNPSASRA